MHIEAHGIRAPLPAGWEGRITRRAPAAVEASRDLAPVGSETTAPVLHMANFALPENRGDFGSGAVDLMRSGHALIVLVEYGPDCADTALFAPARRIPTLTARMFSPNALQRVQRNQAGVQRFFTVNGRAFCLYVVLGDRRDAPRLTPALSQVTAGIEVTHA